MRFFKMNGCGNDYIFLENTNVPTASLVKRMCDVHYGIGADGVVIYSKGVSTDLVMKIFNKDGTEAEMCGNALRCLIRHYDRVGKNVSVQTKAGIKTGIFDGDKVTVNLSKSVSYDTDYVKIICNSQEVLGKRINVGNPHFVIKEEYDDELAKAISEKISIFPERTNVEFYSEINEEIFVRVYERGCGETLACGTGAAAAFIASGKQNALIHLPGGILECSLNDKGEIIQKGKVDYNYQGEYRCFL